MLQPDCNKPHLLKVKGLRIACYPSLAYGNGVTAGRRLGGAAGARSLAPATGGGAEPPAQLRFCCGHGLQIFTIPDPCSVVTMSPSSPETGIPVTPESPNLRYRNPGIGGPWESPQTL